MKSSIPAKKVFILLGSSILLFLVLCLGIVLFTLWGGGGEPATLSVAMRVSQVFIEHLHRGQTDIAYSMLSEKFSPRITLEEFSKLVQQDDRIFKTHQNFEICEWSFFISNGRVINTDGLLFYEDGVIRVQIYLHKDSDTIWRIQGFRFRSD